jgi:hypothetical protein
MNVIFQQLSIRGTLAVTATVFPDFKPATWFSLIETFNLNLETFTISKHYAGTEN